MLNRLHWYEWQICHKIVGACEITDDFRKRKMYTGNIYLHFLKKCLESYDFNFDFNQVTVPERTKDQTPESLKTV